MGSPVYYPHMAGTATRALLLRVLMRLTEELGRSPSPSEVLAAVPNLTRPTLHRHITDLVKEGRVRRTHGGNVLELVPARDPDLEVQILGVVGQLYTAEHQAPFLTSVVMAISQARHSEITQVAYALVQEGKLLLVDGERLRPVEAAP